MSIEITERRRWAREAIALLAVLALGVTISTLPHWWTGNLEWVNDLDELAVYYPMGSHAYNDHPARLTDPTTGGPTYYQPLPTVPGILLARGLDLGVWRLGLCWRVLAGLGVSAGWYVLLRLRLGRVGAVLATMVLLSDTGVCQGKLGYASITDVAKARAVQPADQPTVLWQWRVLNPALTWPWWLGFFIALARAVQKPERWRILTAGIALGLLFHVYFFLWTAAVLGLVLATLFDRRRWRLFASVTAIGGLIGLPALWNTHQFRMEFGEDFLLRNGYFAFVGRTGAIKDLFSRSWWFGGLLLPQGEVVLVIGLWIWVRCRAREWTWLAAMATASLGLLNHTVLDGLAIQNYHWYYALGPAVSILLIFTAIDLYQQLPRRCARYGLYLGGVFALWSLVSGTWLFTRRVETHPAHGECNRVVAAFRSQTDGLPFEPRTVVAGDLGFRYAASTGANLRPLCGYTAFCSPIPDSENLMREALNSLLQGSTREEYRAEVIAILKELVLLPREARDSDLMARMAAWDRVVAEGPNRAIRQFGVRYLALRAESPFRPKGILISAGPEWRIYEIPAQ